MMKFGSEIAVVTPNDTDITTKKKGKSPRSSSAYNLFYQYTRWLESKDVKEIPSDMYGLEAVGSSPPTVTAPDDLIKAYRKRVIEQRLDKYASEDACKKRKKLSSNQMSFIERSQHVGMKWKEADETTKSIFQELAKENSERRQLAEFQMFKAAQARFFIKPPFLKEATEARQVSMPNDDTSTRTETHDHNEMRHGLLHQNVDTSDWAPSPIDGRNEMSLVEFSSMLSNFDWS